MWISEQLYKIFTDIFFRIRFVCTHIHSFLTVYERMWDFIGLGAGSHFGTDGKFERVPNGIIIFNWAVAY